MKKYFFLLLMLVLSSVVSAQTATDVALAQQYYQQADYVKALDIYEKLFAQNPKTYYTPYFNVLLKLKKYDDAEKLLRKLIKAQPTNYAYQIDIGRIYQDKGDQDKVDKWYDDLIKNMPKNEFAIRDLANAFSRVEQLNYSVKAFMAGRKLLNDSRLFTFDLIAVYRYQKNKPMLAQEYLNAIEQNPEISRQAQNTISTIFEGGEDYEILKLSLLRLLQKDPQSIPYAEFLTWVYIQQQDFDMALRQTVALDKRLKEDGERIFELSQIFIANKAYEPASEGLQAIIAKGPQNANYIASKIQLVNVKNQLLISGKYSTQDLVQLETDYQSLLSEFGMKGNTLFAVEQLANLQAFYLNKPKDATKLLEESLKLPGVPPATIGNLKTTLGDIYILDGQVWEAALIYGQIEKQFTNEPLGQEAKYRNAKLSYYQGDFVWANAQLDVLKSSTSQLIANDALNLSLLISENTTSKNDSSALISYAHADLLIFKNQLSEAQASLDSIPIKFPSNSLNDDIMMAKSKIYLKQNDLQKAVEQLQQIIEKHPKDLWADDALFTLADLYETKLNDPEKSKNFYQKIITDYPGSLYVTEARKRFRNLRGDKVE